MMSQQRINSHFKKEPNRDTDIENYNNQNENYTRGSQQQM